MTYHAIGLMSGSSLDGLDIAFVRLRREAGQWQYEWIATDCVPYPEPWIGRLKSARNLTVPQFMQLHTDYGHYTGRAVREFLNRHAAGLQVDFIASHGHTVFHDPDNGTTCQICDGASIAAESGIPVISDLRNMDIAFGGQGAPIVPLGEQLLFADYDYWLNLGGIANITWRRDGVYTAFDVCACNQVLNALAAEKGLLFDRDGAIAAAGHVEQQLLDALNEVEYFRRPVPKSLDNGFSQTDILPLLAEPSIALPDRLCTATEHAAQQISAVLTGTGKAARLLATGGGALNGYLISRLRALLGAKQIEVVVPDMQTVQYKEALIMALLGALRWEGSATVLSSVTGARKDSIGGAVWMV